MNNKTIWCSNIKYSLSLTLMNWGVKSIVQLGTRLFLRVDELVWVRRFTKLLKGLRNQPQSGSRLWYGLDAVGPCEGILGGVGREVAGSQVVALRMEADEGSCLETDELKGGSERESFRAIGGDKAVHERAIQQMSKIGKWHLSIVTTWQKTLHQSSLVGSRDQIRLAKPDEEMGMIFHCIILLTIQWWLCYRIQQALTSLGRIWSPTPCNRCAWQRAWGRWCDILEGWEGWGWRSTPQWFSSNH